MKTKPTRHKEKNTFQFKTFSDRVSEIDIDVFHRVAHKNEENEDEVETFFYQTLRKWNLLNLTEGYCSFKRQVREIVTLPQLLNKKQFVIDLLLEYVKKQNVLFLQPILELVVAVAKDLQKDFYEYFPQFLNAISGLLQTKNTEQIEYAFTALSYLFKFLWRYLIKNVQTVLDLLLPLLSDSQPEYIHNFAAESFAFVVRKVKDRETFYRLLFKILQNSPHGLSGCAKLLFEVISGTQGQFHSCADQMLLCYFNGLKDESINQDLAYSVLEQVLKCILQNIHPSKCDILWNTFLKVLETVPDEPKDVSERKSHLQLTLCLMNMAIDYKKGRMVNNHAPLITKLTHMIDDFETNNIILTEIVNVVITILLSNIKLAQETSSYLLLKVMSINNIELLYNAVEKLIHYSSFETLVLPQILKIFTSTGLKSREVKLLTKVIEQKAPPCLNGITLGKWTKFPLDTRNISKESVDYLIQELKTISDSASLDAFWILIIIPHFKLLPDDIKLVIKQQLLIIYQNILHYESTDSSIDFDRLGFTFLLLLDTVTHICETNEFFEFTKKHDIQMISLLEKHNNDSSILNAVDLYLSYYSESPYHEQFFNEEVFNTLHNCIVQKLSSPNHQIRLIVTHLYSLFNNVTGIMLSKESAGKNPMELIYLAESIPVTVQQYRDKLLHLQSLTFQSYAITNLDSKYYEFPLRYLLGNLYINFSLLWDPISKIIASYATKECTQFWPVYIAELKNTNKTNVSFKQIYDCNIVTNLQSEIYKTDDKPDYDNYKILLWKCMSHFISFCEMKNRDLTSLFIDFVNNNFFKSNSEDAKSCNVKKHEKLPTPNDNMGEEEENEDDEDEDEDDDNDDETTEKKKKADQAKLPVLSRMYKTKLLLAQMEVYGKIANPTVLYREAEMRKIYLDLLTSKNPEIQKAAMNCLCTYKYKYLLPYKENLYTLISEKNFKHELARFKVDKESNVILNEHRGDLMPIVMRIVYAKMVMKTGMRTGGKAGGSLKRKIILRFLAGSQEDEMIMFVEMAFKPFHKYLTYSESANVDLNVLTQNIMNSVDLTNVIPPKRLQSAVNLLAIMIEQFGAKMSTKLLPYLLGILMCIAAMVTGILQKSDLVHSGYLSTLKNVRTTCIAIVARFFVHFENYEWKEHEIDAVFNVMVFPWLEKLPMEGIHSPTALLKLFIAWSQNSRYYPLFIKHQNDNVDVTPIPYIVQLLLGNKTHPSVINAISEMIEKMLTMQDYGKVTTDPDQMDVDMPFVPLTPVLNNLLPINDAFLSNGVNYGSVVLLPHVPNILEYIKRKLKNSSRGMNKTELTILSRISEFAKDPDTCDTLLTLILPVLMKKAITQESEEIITELIMTVTNLIKNVKAPDIHIRAITPLLSVISSVPARKLLIQLYNIIAERSTEENRESILKNYKLLEELNAWDRRWVEQPDFQRRLDAFGEINKLIEANEVTLNCGVSILYNCFFFLKNESDLAMKDCSGQCLKNLGPNLARKYKDNPSDRRYLMDETILQLIKKGISSKSEVLCLQSIGFLGHMSMECPEVHPILRDLSLLCNKVDPEVDFFENMQHLQMHRRARALLKFCSISKTMTKAPNPKTLTLFILPLASTYLCNEAFLNKNSLIDTVIETVGTVCRLLPWHHYEIILKYYLSKLRTNVQFQKQIIKLIVAILDAFHYDLSKYKSLEEVARKELALPARDDKSDTKDDTEEKENDDDANEDKIPIGEDTEETMEVELNNDNIVEVEDTSEKVNVDLPIMQRQTVLSQYGSKRVIFSISKGLLPQLHRSILARSYKDSTHKVNKKKVIAEIEEEDLMRVPIALALVKLLQKLPEGILESNLPGIFMKLCTFLKSRLESVRRTTREVLQKIMITVGPKYLSHLLKELNSLLTKGFQVHVLAYTIHSVLVVLKPHFQKFDIDNNLQSILSVCKIDLFGLSAEEKEVIGIVKNVSEAKSTKSYDIFHIMAEFITESRLLDLLTPLKDVLFRTHSHKTIQKVVECLKNIVIGLADNTFISLQQMLTFLNGVISESIPELMPTAKNPKLTSKEAEILSRQKPDSFIILPEPKSKMGIKAAAKTSTDTNAHVMIEFGLKLYHIFLKREKISSVEFKSYLEPVVSILAKCLKSQHVKLCSLALQCLNWILKMDLTSVRELISDICVSIFDILHKYAAAGLSKGDNFDLVTTAFKCMSVLVRDVKHFTINADQLKILLLYAEQDLHDSDKQATAFGLLKAIIKRKLVVPEMYTVMEKVAALSITSELEHVRLQSRNVFYSYLMEYPLGKHLDKHIAFYLFQLGYDMQYGRMSALKMIHSIITGFPVKNLTKHAGLIFLNTSARLVNDEDPACRKLCAACIKDMLTRLPHNERDKLFDIVSTWLKDSKVIHRRLAAQLCGIFVVVEKENFESRLEKILPILLQQFHDDIDAFKKPEPGRFVKLRPMNEEYKHDSNIKDPERLKDHHLFQVLQLLLKISSQCPGFLKNKKYTAEVAAFAEHSQSLLAHPHMWVRLGATQLVGFILSVLDIDKIVEILKNPKKETSVDGYVYSNPIETLRSLTLDLIAQLQPDLTFEELADQVVKNLIFIARVFKSIQSIPSNANLNDDHESKDGLCLLWLMKRLRKSINIEVIQAPKSISVRNAVFKWIAGIVATMPMEGLSPILFNMMSPLVREISTSEESNAPLRQLAKEVATMIKKQLDSEEYTKLLNQVQQKLDSKKTERRKIRKQQFVTDPELAAKRKIAKQQKKKESKKRKLDTMKGRKPARKRPKKEIDLDNF